MSLWKTRVKVALPSFRNRMRRIVDEYVTMKTIVLHKKDVIVLAPKHVPELKGLISEESTQMFGSVDIEETLYNGYSSLGVLNPKGEIVGAAVFANNPNVSAVHPSCWVQWMHHMFGCYSVTQCNSAWIQLLLWRPEFTNVFLNPILQYFFSKQGYKQYVMVVIPPGIKTVKFLGYVPIRIHPKGNYSPISCTTLGLMKRQYYTKNYTIRKAVPEDNDDLVPLISKHKPYFQKLYGDYYISELLTMFPDSTRSIVVAEYEGYAVAVIIMNEVVNYDVLSENFELVCFHGLKEPHDDDFIGNPEVDEAELGGAVDLEIPSSAQMKNFERSKVSAVGVKEAKDIDDFWQLTDSTHKHLSPCPVIIDDFDDSKSFSLYSEECSLDSSKFSKTYSLSITKGEEKRTEVLRPLDHLASRPVPKYQGRKNAFVLEVVAAKEDHEEAIDLLIEATFETFPERNYCCISIPTKQPPADFHERFVRVTPRNDGKFPHELFLLHRNTLKPNLVVRMAIDEDLPYIKEFLGRMHNPGDVLKMVEFAMSTDPSVENSSNLCYVMTAYRQVVGIAVLSENIELDYIVAHYAMYKWVDKKHQNKDSFCVLEALLIYPIFHNFATFFLAQIHTLADYSAIFYVITPEDMSKNRRRPICNIIQQFKPIMPRMVQEYSQKHLKGDCLPPESITKLEEPFSLYLSMTRMCSVRRIEINSRIVVVGSGVTTSSFLETLIYKSSKKLLVTFNNLVVVSPHGLSHQGPPNKARDKFFVHKGHFSHRYMHLTSLRAHTNFATNVITEIRRSEKRVMTNDGTFLPYDILVLLFGEQYQAPILKGRWYSGIPKNLFILNTDTDAALALRKLAKIMAEDINPEGKVVVYGHNLRSYCTLAALVEFGIPKDLLVFINPVSRTFDVENLISYDNLIFDDPEIDVAILEILQKEGIAMYQGFINDWSLNVEQSYIDYVQFECASRMLVLKCKALFFFSTKSISKVTFETIVKSDLVFDGRLVIDSNFRTNDPHIYAAGSATKYSRKYHAEYLSHLYYNSEEVGEKLGLHIRNMLIPEEFKMKRPKKPERFPMKIKKSDLPVFTKPIVKSCAVVGNLNYCHIRKAGKQKPVELEIGGTDYGHVYVTGNLKNLDKQGYFRIHVNAFDIVETITCLTKDEIYVNGLLQIWGKHVSMLNNLHLRFEMMTVPDLFEFFKEPWTCAIYLDRFVDTRKKMCRIILNNEMSRGETPAETVYWYLVTNSWKHLTNHQRNELLKLFNESAIPKKIEDQIVQYIEANSTELPMYAHPNLIRHVLRNYEKSPMFTE